jgi:hypothetical protein
MAPADVYDFFRSVIEANWTYTRIKWPNEQTFKANSQPYLELQFPLNIERIGSLGPAGSFYLPNEGAAVITIYAPIGSGVNDASAPWRTRGDALIAALRPKTFANGLGETYEATSDECYEEGSYFVRSIAIAYHYQKFG